MHTVHTHVKIVTKHFKLKPSLQNQHDLLQYILESTCINIKISTSIYSADQTVCDVAIHIG